MIDPQTLYDGPNALAPFYSHFRVSERLLLTGHSHQAWPDCAIDGQRQAWLDAAEHLDGKWERAFAKADRVRRGFRRIMDDSDGHIALAPNTHDLLIRFLSGLPLKKRPRIVTTDGEYHSIRRQVDRLAEEGIDVHKVSAYPAANVAGRLVDAIDEGTAAVLVSSVYYQTAHIVPHLGDVMEACQRLGTELLVDAYHGLNAVPFSLKSERLEGAFVVGGGYKYCQLGEGNCFLRFPRGGEMRPVITGWFSEFSTLAEERTNGHVVYGRGPDRFAGSTYDPTSHYRAAQVFDFFEKHSLTPEFLREVSRHQVALLAKSFDDLGADSKIITRDRSVSLDAIGGFLALISPHAESLCTRLRERGVLADHRGNLLRLGPAPYLTDAQITGAIDALGEIV